MSPLSPGMGRRPPLTWETQHWGAQLWSQVPAGPACPRCPPSWQPLRGPAVNTSPLQPAPEGHTQSLRTHRSPCPAPCTHGCPIQDRPGGPAGEPRLQGLKGAGLHLLQTLTLLPLLLLSSPIYLSPESCSQAGGHPSYSREKDGACGSSSPTPHPVAWTHHCRDLHSWLFLWSQHSWLPLVCLALGNREWGQSRMERTEWGSCQRPMPGLTEYMLPQGSPVSPWDWPQRMPPIATCLPALGKRRGKKGRSSPRQVLPGAVVSEGAAGTAGMLSWLGREGGKRWWWWCNSQGCPTLDPALSGCADCRFQSGNQNERLPQRNACRETDRRTDGQTDRRERKRQE